MKIHVDKSHENHNRSAAGAVIHEQNHAIALPILDNRPEAVQMRRLQKLANMSSGLKKPLHSCRQVNQFKSNSLVVENEVGTTETMIGDQFTMASSAEAVSMANAAVFHTLPAVPVIQRTLKVTYNKKNGKWNITGRPSFRSFVLRTLIEKHNKNVKKKKDKLDIDTVSLTEEELDQCHVMAWATIRDELVKAFLNNELTEDEFIERTDALYGSEPDKVEYENMTIIRGRITDAIGEDDDPNESDIKELCTLLNSATPNLRLDGSKINRKIRDRPDPHLVNTPRGRHYSMTPNSRQILSTNEDVMRDLLWTPGGTHFYNSSIGEVTPSRLTRGSQSVMGRRLNFDSDSDSD
jgi:hypothetical protein